MPADNEVERTVVHDPVTGQSETYIRSAPGAANATGWWVAAVIAVVAIVGLFFMLNGNRTSDTDLQAAMDAGRAQAAVDQATLATQNAAAQASMATQSAADSLNRASEAATTNARDAAARAEAAAASAQTSASNAAATITVPSEEAPPQ